jgi:hypothetical protein
MNKAHDYSVDGGVSVPGGVRRGTLSHAPPWDTAPAEVWALPGPSQTPAFFASRPPTRARAEVAISSAACWLSKGISNEVGSSSMSRRAYPRAR